MAVVHKDSFTTPCSLPLSLPIVHCTANHCPILTVQKEWWLHTSVTNTKYKLATKLTPIYRFHLNPEYRWNKYPCSLRKNKWKHKHTIEKEQSFFIQLKKMKLFMYSGETHTDCIFYHEQISSGILCDSWWKWSKCKNVNGWII